MLCFALAMLFTTSGTPVPQRLENGVKIVDVAPGTWVTEDWDQPNVPLPSLMGKHWMVVLSPLHKTKRPVKPLWMVFPRQKWYGLLWKWNSVTKKFDSWVPYYPLLWRLREPAMIPPNEAIGLYCRIQESEDMGESYRDGILQANGRLWIDYPISKYMDYPVASSMPLKITMEDWIPTQPMQIF